MILTLLWEAGMYLENCQEVSLGIQAMPGYSRSFPYCFKMEIKVTQQLLIAILLLAYQCFKLWQLWKNVYDPPGAPLTFGISISVTIQFVSQNTFVKGELLLSFGI